MLKREKYLLVQQRRLLQLLFPDVFFYFSVTIAKLVLIMLATFSDILSIKLGLKKITDFLLQSMPQSRSQVKLIHVVIRHVNVTPKS